MSSTTHAKLTHTKHTHTRAHTRARTHTKHTHTKHTRKAHTQSTPTHKAHTQSTHTCTNHTHTHKAHTQNTQGHMQTQICTQTHAHSNKMRNITSYEQIPAHKRTMVLQQTTWLFAYPWEVLEPDETGQGPIDHLSALALAAEPIKIAVVVRIRLKPKANDVFYFKLPRHCCDGHLSTSTSHESSS
jgi:hypothetical protein